MKEILLTTLRNKNTSLEDYRKAADTLADLIALESDGYLAKKERSVETPLGKTTGYFIQKKPILVPVLRSGLVLLFAFCKIYNSSSVGILGIKRDEKTAEPHLYYKNLPPIHLDDPIFLLDPMIATGNTAALSIETLQKKGASLSQIIIFSVIASEEGLKNIKKRFPSVRIHVVQIDKKLDSSKWIVPGLGDFGDRYFGTLYTL
jgi:uracil phosphoribosyltransferase